MWVILNCKGDRDNKIILAEAKRHYDGDGDLTRSNQQHGKQDSHDLFWGAFGACLGAWTASVVASVVLCCFFFSSSCFGEWPLSPSVNLHITKEKFGIFFFKSIALS